LITHNDEPQLVGFPWTSDQLVAETSIWQHTTNTHAPGGIRTHDRSRWAAIDLCLRPRGHWDRHMPLSTISLNAHSNVHVYSCRQFIGLSNRNGRVSTGPTDTMTTSGSRFVICRQTDMRNWTGAFIQHFVAKAPRILLHRATRHNKPECGSNKH
jgi:hypothetical protein